MRAEVTLCWGQVLQAMEYLNPGVCGWDRAHQSPSPALWALSCCWPRMEILIPGAQQEPGYTATAKTGDFKKCSWIWRSSCSFLYCSILNLHPLHAKHVIKPLAVQRLTISGRSSKLNTVLTSLLLSRSSLK